MIRILLLALAASAAIFPFHDIQASDLSNANTQTPPLQKPVIPTPPLTAPPVPSIPALIHSPPRAAAPFILIFIDFRDLMCPACLDSLLSLCRSLPDHLIKTSVFGIVHRQGSFPPSPRKLMITQKKIRGFILANGIDFPVLIDKGTSQETGIIPTGSQIWVCSRSANRLFRFDLPLSAADINAFIRAVYAD